MMILRSKVLNWRDKFTQRVRIPPWPKSPLDAIQFWVDFFAWIIVLTELMVAFSSLTRPGQVALYDDLPTFVVMILLFTLVLGALVVDKLVDYKKTQLEKQLESSATVPQGNPPADAQETENLGTPKDSLPPTVTSSADHRSPSAEQVPPWKQIPDHGWDRLAVELWSKGYTCKEIARKIDVSEKTVLNRLSDLRKTHGEEIIPSDERRKRKLG